MRGVLMIEAQFNDRYVLPYRFSRIYALFWIMCVYD